MKPAATANATEETAGRAARATVETARPQAEESTEIDMI
jgi:hypothetical protein